MKIGNSPRLAIFLLALLLLPLLIGGCSRQGYNQNWQHTAATLHEGKYTVAVRVTNTGNQPVAGVSAILVKRFLSHPLRSHLPVIPPSEELVAVTDRSGEISFQFELLRADDVWLYLDPGENSGYAPRYVHLNKHMGDSIFQTDGNSAFLVRVILERTAAN